MNDQTRIESTVQTPARFSIDEFMQIAAVGIFNDMKIELVEGVIVRMSPPTSVHSQFQKRLYDALLHAYATAGGSWVVQFELTVQVSEASLRVLDVGVMTSDYSGERFGDPTKLLLGAEIAVSTLDYDLGEKQADYARTGIPQYWVVDVEARCTHMMSKPMGDSYSERHPVAFGDPLAVPGTDQTIVIG